MLISAAGICTRTILGLMRTLAVLTLITAAALAAQDAPIQHIQAELTTTIKLAKAKVGDKVKAQLPSQVTLANGTLIPAGSTMLGQIKQVDTSSVTLVFDQVNADGKKIPLNVTLVAAALMGGPKTEMSEGSGNAKMASDSPSDHPLNGGRYSVTEAGNNAANGVSHESLSEVNAAGNGSVVKRGADVPAHAGSVIGMPGVKLSVDDGPPYESKFEIATKDMQLPKGVQLMFSLR